MTSPTANCRNTPCHQRRNDRQPPHGACPPAGAPALEHAHPTRAPKRTEPHRLAFSAPNSVRRPASASRTYGRCAVDPPGRSLTPTPPCGAPNSRRRSTRKKINDQNYGVDRPRSFRNDNLTRMVILIVVAHLGCRPPSQLPTYRSKSTTPPPRRGARRPRGGIGLPAPARCLCRAQLRCGTPSAANRSICSRSPATSEPTG